MKDGGQTSTQASITLARTLWSHFSTTSIVLVLIVSVLLGYRRLRDIQYFKVYPTVLRLLGLHHMPAVSTISQQLSTVDDVVSRYRTLTAESGDRGADSRISLPPA